MCCARAHGARLRPANIVDSDAYKCAARLFKKWPEGSDTHCGPKLAGFVANMEVHAANHASSKRTILVVDDDEPMRLAFYGVLSPHYQVTLAVDGLDGVDKSKDQPLPDLIIADIVMPRLDGIEMVRRIRERDAVRVVPVIFVSGQMSVGSILAGLSLLPFGYLSKPPNAAVLVKKVRRALGEL